MRAAVGLACLVMLGSCGRPPETPLLSFGPDLAEDFAALPRIVSATPQARAINAMLDQRDAAERSERSDCLEMKPQNDNVYWGRSVSAPMVSPRFVSVLVTQGDYCGGAHGDWSQSPVVFDLDSGGLIDWKDWLPADMATPVETGSPNPGLNPPHLTSPSLKAWFAVRAIASMDEYGRADCAEVYSEDRRDTWGLVVWPDAKASGLTFQTEGLAYASMGCQVEVTMPLAELRRRGVARELIESIETTHERGGWRDFPPEPPATPEKNP